MKERPKSMLAAKSFEPISDMAAVERWVTNLAKELADRMVADNKLFNRRPKSLHLHYRYACQCQAAATGDHAKGFPTSPVCCANAPFGLRRLPVWHLMLMQIPMLTANQNL